MNTVVRDRCGEWIVVDARGKPLASGFFTNAEAWQWIDSVERPAPRKPKQLRLPLKSYGQRGQRVMCKPEPRRKQEATASSGAVFNDSLDDVAALEGKRR